MEQHESGISRIFKPKSSMGWLSLLFLGVILAGIAILVIWKVGWNSPTSLVILAVFAAAILALITLALFFPAMNYEIRGRTIYLRYGPVLRYEIPINEIRSIRKTDLPLSIMSSFRFPGIALFNIPTSTEGDIKMCSTASVHQILIIETKNDKFGLTPENEEAFITSIQAKMPR